MAKKNKASLRAVVNSKREKRYREMYKDVQAREVKLNTTRQEIYKDVKASKEDIHPKLNGIGLDNSIIESAFNMTGLTEEYVDLMSKTVEKESINRALLDQYVDHCTVINHHARRDIRDFILNNTHLNIDANGQLFITIDKKEYSKIEQSAHIYGNETAKICEIIKNIPEMFNYLAYRTNIDETYTGHHLKMDMSAIMSDFMDGIITKTGKVDTSLIHSVIANDEMPESITRNGRDAINVVLKMNNLTYTVKFRFVEKIIYNVGFFMEPNNT